MLIYNMKVNINKINATIKKNIKTEFFKDILFKFSYS